MKHTVRQRILGAILFGALLFVGGSEGFCQETCDPGNPNCRIDFNFQDILENDLGNYLG